MHLDAGADERRDHAAREQGRVLAHRASLPRPRGAGLPRWTMSTRSPGERRRRPVLPRPPRGARYPPRRRGGRRHAPRRATARCTACPPWAQRRLGTSRRRWNTHTRGVPAGSCSSCTWKDRSLVRDLLAQAKAHGFRALALTVDLTWYGNRERDTRNGFTVPAYSLRQTLDALRRPVWTWDFLSNPEYAYAALDVAAEARARRAPPSRRRVDLTSPSCPPTGARKWRSSMTPSTRASAGTTPSGWCRSGATPGRWR